MDKITKIDRAACAKMRAALEEVLPGIAEELGVSISAGSGSFSDNTFSLKVEFATISEDGNVNTKEAQDFTAYCSRWDLEPEVLNQTFTDVSSGDLYKVIGAKPRSKKYPILCEKKSDGTVYKFPANRVARAFGAMAIGVSLAK